MTNQDNYEGSFHIDYDLDRDVFKAYGYSPKRNTWTTREISPSLEQLLEKCRQGGLTTFEGLTSSAIDRIHSWLVVDRPTLEYVEGLWGDDPGPSAKGPLGFRPPTEPDLNTFEDI